MIIAQLIEGIFIEEGKSRFICYVEIKGEIQECYVPSSSKLTKHLELRYKKVLLSANTNSQLRTKYSLFAVIEKGVLIFVNLNILNKIVEEGILKGKQIFLQNNFLTTVEKTIHGYRADVGFWTKNNEEKEIVEVKGIISTKEEAIHPQINSKRSIEQLRKLKQILEEGHKVHYFLIALSPTIKGIRIDNKSTVYCQLMQECLELGMSLRGFSLVFNLAELRLGNEIPVIFERSYTKENQILRVSESKAPYQF